MVLEIKISAKRYDEALTYLALVMDRYGDEYWPIFQVLEDEYNIIQERQRKIQSRVPSIKPLPIVKNCKPKFKVYESF